MRSMPRAGSERSSAPDFEDADARDRALGRSWDTRGIRAFYGTFSPIARLDAQRRGRDPGRVARIAEQRLRRSSERTLVTSLYTRAEEADRRARGPYNPHRVRSHDAPRSRCADVLGRRRRRDRRVEMDGADRPRPLRGPEALHRARALVRRDQPAHTRRETALARVRGHRRCARAIRSRRRESSTRSRRRARRSCRSCTRCAASATSGSAAASTTPNNSRAG